jgi:hypothetical protein
MRLTSGTQSIEVTVIDVIEPNPLAHGHTLSIDPAAKRTLTSTDQNLDVQFSFVPCTVVDSIQLEFAGADDPSVLVLGHRNPLRSVKLSTPGVSVNLERQSYNYWTPPPGFSSSGNVVSLTLVDSAGAELTVPNIVLGVDPIDTGQQFPFPECFSPGP